MQKSRINLASGNGSARKTRTRQAQLFSTNESSGDSNVITAKWKKGRRRGGGRRETERGKESRLSAVARVQVHNDKMQSPNGGNFPFPTDPRLSPSRYRKCQLATDFRIFRTLTKLSEIGLVLPITRRQLVSADLTSLDLKFNDRESGKLRTFSRIQQTHIF